MPVTIRHETPGLISAYGDVSALAGRKQTEQEKESRRRQYELQDREYELQQQQMENQQQQFYDRLEQREKDYKRRHRERIQLQEIQHQQNLEQMEFEQQLRTQGRTKPIEFEYTPEQRQKAYRVRQAIQNLEEADHLRPDEKKVMREQLYNQLFGIQPIPKLPEDQEPSPVQKELSERVWQAEDGRGHWILQQDGDIDFQPMDRPLEPQDLAKMFDTAAQMLTTINPQTGKENPPKPEEVRKFVQENMLPLLGQEMEEQDQQDTSPPSKGGTKGPGKPVSGAFPGEKQDRSQQLQGDAKEFSQRLEQLKPSLRTKFERTYKKLKSDLVAAEKRGDREEYMRLNQKIKDLINTFLGGVE